MTRLLKYELRRLLINKFFLGLLVVNGLFAWYILTSDTVAGVAYTSPFSPWSFSAYLASVMPMAILTVLFLLTFFHSKNEKQVTVLTSTTPMDTVRYALIRMIALTVGFLLLCALLIGMSLYFYAVYFDYWECSVFVVPAIVTILPCFVFILGVGHWIGRIDSRFLYALMLIFFMMNFIQIPGEFDLFGGGYYTSIPLSLPAGMDGEPAFVLNMAFLAARALYLVVGMVLFIVSVRPARKK